MTTRLYVLELDGGNIVVEISDVHSSPGTADDYLDVISALEFDPT